MLAAVEVDLKDRSSLAVAPDGRTVAIWGRSRSLFLWDAGARGPVRRAASEDDYITAATFSADGQLVAVGNLAGEVCVRSAASGKERCRFTGHTGAILSLAFAPDDRRLASSSADRTALIWGIGDKIKVAPVPAAPADKLTNTELGERWDELMGTDAVKARAAVIALAQAPSQAVPLLGERLRPVSLDPKHIPELVADLDSNRFAVRQKAAADLEKLREVAEPALREALAKKPSLELQRRIEQLLDKLTGPRLSGEGLRSWRAIEVLEAIGTPEARKVLEKLADGTPGFPQTDEARASLERLRRLRPEP